MSTRCQIGFYPAKNSDIAKPQALLYKHLDGYPEGTLPLLEAFCRAFNAKRGLDDIEYAAAWYLHELMTANDAKGFSGYGICDKFHSDIEYFYFISPTEIRVYETPPDAHAEAYILQTTVPLTQHSRG